ncbi:MAG: hypothetical protein CMJ81_17350 [Planctomycetaceae bacterium]|nr:hypothetical protein [Planctomycetaceae bacterium]MBP62149.1 hypothetical protein [Planctomycetaceae bacterium]
MNAPPEEPVWYDNCSLKTGGDLLGELDQPRKEEIPPGHQALAKLFQEQNQSHRRGVFEAIESVSSAY